MARTRPTSPEALSARDARQRDPPSRPQRPDDPPGTRTLGDRAQPVRGRRRRHRPGRPGPQAQRWPARPPGDPGPARRRAGRDRGSHHMIANESPRVGSTGAIADQSSLRSAGSRTTADLTFARAGLAIVAAGQARYLRLLADLLAPPPMAGSSSTATPTSPRRPTGPTGASALNPGAAGPRPGRNPTGDGPITRDIDAVDVTGTPDAAYEAADAAVTTGADPVDMLLARLSGVRCHSREWHGTCPRAGRR